MGRASPSAGQESGARYTLPVSRLRVMLREPTGMHALLLVETADDDAAALALADDLASDEGGEEIAWPQLSPTDLDVVILRLRQARLGDRIVSRMKCRAEGCAALVDISF